MIPRQRPGQSFDDHQAEVAAWMGCSVGEMNAAHDPMHRSLCAWLGVPSHSLACAAGDDHDARLAGLEEEAVLHVQRLAVAYSVEVSNG